MKKRNFGINPSIVFGKVEIMETNKPELVLPSVYRMDITKDELADSPIIRMGQLHGESIAFVTKALRHVADELHGRYVRSAYKELFHVLVNSVLKGAS